MDRAARFQELFAIPTSRSATQAEPVQEQQTPITDDSLDDRERLQRLFGVTAPPEVRRSAPQAPSASALRPSAVPLNATDDDADGWPRHNYNAAYQSVRQERPIRRPRTPKSESELWEINALLDPVAPPPATPQAPAPSPAAWPDHRPLFEPSPDDLPTTENGDPERWNHEGWLERLADNQPGAATTTEAHLVRTLWGEPGRVRAPLFEAKETLYARAPGQGTPTSETPRAPAARTRKKLTDRLLMPKRMRGLVLRTAGVLLGLKIGLTLGYAAAFLL